ncbi:THO complex subunit 2, partial [Ascosphaera pollenicola]
MDDMDMSGSSGDMGGMDMGSSNSSDSNSGHGSSMSMSMAMTFVNAHDTPLFSKSWTPDSTGKYAGTCIFLIILAIINRLLMALKTICEKRWHAQAMNRRYVVVEGQQPVSEQVMSDDDSKQGTLITAQGLNEKVRVVQRAGVETIPWRFTVDLPRAALGAVIAGVSYLL